MSILVKVILRPALLGLASSLLLAACVSTEREPATPGHATRTEFTPPSGKGQRVSGATVLNAVEASHTFSSAQAPDKFVLQLRGPRVLTGRLQLLVLSSRGDTLHQETIPARRLQDPAALTVRDQEISVLKGMNNFFADSRFSSAAVGGATSRPAGLSTEAWSTLRADPQARAFDYPTADGSQHRLVYSPKLGRAVVLAD